MGNFWHYVQNGGQIDTENKIWYIANLRENYG